MMPVLFDIRTICITVLGYPLSYVELVGTVSGLVSVWLAARSNIWTWPVGILNVVCFFAIFLQVHLYADMVLQVYFFIVSIYGWVLWKGRRGRPSAPITTLTNRGRLTLATVVPGATLVLGTLTADIHRLLPTVFSAPASYPYVDTFVAVLSVAATVLLAQRKLENWAL